ncbi:hypothetical protein L3X38_007885 [Prunus dulcis]|uniref:Uncharacterized protein n=1 Tax=Prunus dulcis TaxID=3755 RepID=A0AAD4ZVG2_PRUDU|nr:hypothetical protein L3X38_007885 [Prunus dulcis]
MLPQASAARGCDINFGDGKTPHPSSPFLPSFYSSQLDQGKRGRNLIFSLESSGGGDITTSEKFGFEPVDVVGNSRIFRLGKLAGLDWDVETKLMGPVLRPPVAGAERIE